MNYIKQKQAYVEYVCLYPIRSELRGITLKIKSIEVSISKTLKTAEHQFKVEPFAGYVLKNVLTGDVKMFGAKRYPSAPESASIIDKPKLL